MDYTKEQYQEILNSCTCKADFCRALNIPPIGNRYYKIDKIISKYDLDISHFKRQPWNKGKKWKLKHYSLDDILIQNSPHKNAYSLKKRLILAGIKLHKCELCGYEDKVELHHINGDHYDNRLENLLILCPNCHSKTNTFRGKNKYKYNSSFRNPKLLLLSDEEAKQRDLETLARKRHKNVEELLNSKTRDKKTYGTCKLCGKVLTVPRTKYCSHECYIADRKLVNRPSAILLINDLKEYKAFTRIGEKYNVSDNAIRKWCKLYMLPTNSKELLEFLESQNIIPYIIRQNDKISYNKGEQNSSYGTKWLTNGTINKKVSNEEIELYLQNGWNFGRIDKKKK